LRIIFVMILVTGCAGFIGSHLCERLLSDGQKVVGLDNFDAFYPKSVKLKNMDGLFANPHFTFYEGDICDQAIWKKLKVHPITCVVHLAARAGVLPSLANPGNYIETNINGTYHLLEYMKKNEIRNLVFASSSSVYGNNTKIPFQESDSVDHPISPYAFTKKSCELMIHSWYHLYKINAICLRFFTVFGPRQRPDLAIRKFVTKIIQNEPIEMYGDGNTARDYTYIDDIVDGIISSINYCCTKEEVYEIINLGNHHPVTLQNLISTIYLALKKPEQVIKVPMKPGDVCFTYADISKASSLLNYAPKISLESGLHNFIEWYQSNDK